MKFRTCAIILLFCATHSKGQLKNLKNEEISKVFTKETRTSLNLKYPIFKAYTYSDKSGHYYLVLTESRDSITSENDTINKNIKAVNIKAVNGTFSKKWEINDFINPNSDETSIWFWTKYINLKDYSNDSLIDPIIIYGTSGINGYSDGRIKFIIYYKGQKIIIRHQNGVLDFERHTQIDKAFYSLPLGLQDQIKLIMKTMTESDQAIFPSGWQKAMLNKLTYISEKK